MHIGFRYHVASLVAIFFSLVLGMLIGSALFQDDRLVQEQGHIISDLENRFKSLEVRTQVLQENLALAEQKERLFKATWDQVSHVIFANRLKNRDVVLISASGKNDELKRIEKLLTIAGARIHTEYISFKETNWLESLSELKVNLKDERPTALVWLADEKHHLTNTSISALKNQGWYLGFLHPFNSSATLKEFADSHLVIDAANTPFGELAVFLGMSKELTGYFGVEQGRTSLLSEVDVDLFQ